MRIKLEKSSALQGRKSYRAVLVIFVVICLLTTLFSYQYYRNLHGTIREESSNYLQEVARRIGSNVDRIISDSYAVLYTMTSLIETQSASTFAQVQPALQKQQTYWNYKSIMLVDDGGRAYDLDNKQVFLTVAPDMLEDMLNHRQSMSTTQIVNNQEYILFSVPLNDIVLDGRNMVALAATYDPSSFDQVLSMNSFDEKAYSQIITKAGTVVTRSSSAFAMKSGYNIFSTLENATLDEESNLAKLKDDVSKDQAGQIGFVYEGVHRYMVYTPIQPDEWYLLTFVPVQVVNEKSDTLLQSTLLMCGLIALAFACMIAALVYLFSNHRRKLEQIAYVDEVTGGNTIQRFYQFARTILDSSQGTQYALVYSNIEKFKVLNEQLGRKNCDTILRCFYSYISSTLSSKECMGRLSADNFCILLEYQSEKEILKRFTEWFSVAEGFVVSGEMPWNLPVTEFGIYVVENNTLPFPQMIDRAKLALRESPHAIDSRLHYAFYNDGVRRQLIREKQLEDMMDLALAEREFQVYLQPKYHLPDETIGGAEALARWESASEGMIYPNEFIPLFEKNGFIVQLDLWIYEEVCRTIRDWTDRGLTPVKVSINCSRVHFRDLNFLTPYIQIADLYGVDRKYIEIELTESIVLENVERLTAIIDEIRGAGFGCSMDDFGSGYSSLNLIQTIPVDTLKLDKIFFRSGPVDLERTEAVTGSIVSMAKALSMETVAEGVEHREQVEMLKKVGCDYIQGYVFAKPMKVSAFEELAFGEIKA